MKKTWRDSFLRSALAISLAVVMLGILQSAVAAQSQSIQVPGESGSEHSLPVGYAAGKPGLAGSVTLPAQPLTPTLAVLRKLHPQLSKQLLTGSVGVNSPDIPIVVVMRAQPNLQSRAIATAATAAARRAALVDQLQSTAAQSQAGVRVQLVEAQLAGQARAIRSLWINNSIAAQVDRAVLVDLAAREDVALIKPDRYLQWITPTLQSPISNLQSPTSIEWNIVKIHADQVWSALGITGTGVVVANIDTGVDWQHPALHMAYRGYNPKGLVNHLGNWFDATSFGAVYPVDGNGHGTHTIGTMVGQNGIGVAPGARWIAARAFGPDGYAYDSWLHAAFQWILAPNGDASRAPDIVNNSWGTNEGWNEEFRQDVQILNAAGIATFFSNGNSGPTTGTVAAPAAYPEAFGVGATDDVDTIARFSSRGPSPFGPIKPDVSAPGVNVRSSFPGGAYLEASGTSMAAPHVSGIAALLRAAAPDASIAELRYALTSTAMRPTTGTYPNNIYGWGRVDAWPAALAVTHTAILSGVVLNAADASPVAQAALRAESAQGTAGEAVTDGQGRYTIYAAAGSYTVTAAAFGFITGTQIDVVLTTTASARQDFSLTSLPTGYVSGTIANLTGTQISSVQLSIAGTPVKLIVSGTYSLNLPIGAHVLQVQAPRHRVITATVTITAGSAVVQDFILPDAPTILLVDSGRWYNGSGVGFYRQALHDDGYLYDDWPIINLDSDVPTSATLHSYEAVIWSAPSDSPGLIGADAALRDYLARGGHLLISGQDVGYYDGAYLASYYYLRQLLATLADDDAPTRRLTGTEIFAGQVISIAGPGGTDNQAYPDVIASSAPLLTSPAFYYAPDQLGGQTVGLCQPYRAVYLAYGFEAITDRAARSDILSRTLGFFAQPPTTRYYRFDHAPDPLIAPAGSTATGAFDLYNFDEVATTTFSVTLTGAWHAAISPTLVTLAPCASRRFTVTIDIPFGASFGEVQPLTLTAIPLGNGGPLISTTLIAKAPGSVLLVKDDRWYNVDGAYRAALEANGITYDVWDVPKDWAGLDPAFPSADRLSWYPQVMWFTGYDWYQTITISNEQALAGYLARNGRLLLSSQDYHNDIQSQDLTDFSRNVLGILDRQIDVTTTLAHGPRGSLLDGITFAPLKPPYHKYIDALAPQPAATVVVVGDHGWPIALAHDMGFSKTLFLSFGFEGLPPAVQPEVMNRFVGYLSWLGRSGVTFDRVAARPGESITATLSVVNDGSAPIARAAFTATLPPSATLIAGDALTWNDSLLPGLVLTRTWVLSLAADLNAGSSITFPIALADVDHALHFTTQARLRVTEPDLQLNLRAQPALAREQDVISWTLTARNLSFVAADTIITANVPFSMTTVSGTLAASAGGASELSGTITWSGAVGAQEIVTLTYQTTLPLMLVKRLWYGSAIATTADEVWHTGEWLQSLPYEIYLPLLRK